MADTIHTYIGNDMLEELVQFCAQLPEEVFTLVADENTYTALGKRVEGAFTKADLTLTSIILQGEEVIADENYLMKVFLKAPIGPQIFLAVGSGTITDITRYVSFRTQNSFISVPTAPSVDGFISLGAPLVVGGLKDTYPTQAPLAVFADLETLANAPKVLIAAGFGDIIGKITALADWRLEHLIWGDPFSQAVEIRVRNALQKCIDSADAIASRSPEGIQYLMEALLESGTGMIEFGNSRPASGAEHHCSHYWEMKLLEEHRPALLHGAKVGFATMLIAAQYDMLRKMTRSDVMNALEAATWPRREEQVTEIERVYGTVAPDIIRIQQPYLDLTPEKLDEIRHLILEKWDEILTIAATVPAPDKIKELLERVGSPTSAHALGLEPSKISEALRFGHLLRRRFTVMKLLKFLGVAERNQEV